MKRVIDQLRNAVTPLEYAFGTPRDYANGVTKVKVLAMPSADEMDRAYRARSTYQKYVNRLASERLAFRRILLAARIEGLSEERMSLRSGWVLGRATKDIGRYIRKGDVLVYQIHPNCKDLPVSLYAPAGGHVYGCELNQIEEV